MRQALAGMLWSKQFYHYDVDKWLEERGSDPFKANRKQAPRNDHWHHMYNGDVISMPDKWEYPWYAAWDLAFHVLALTLVDPDFGKQQLKLMLRERYMHPNGQIPAYEWNFGDVNPPVHAWSTIFTYRLEKAQNGRGRQGMAQEQLPEAAAELHLVGQPQGPHRGGTSSRAASWAWTTSASSTAARRCRPAATWSRPTAPPGWPCSARTCSRSPPSWRMTDPDYADMALKFVEHFLWIASSMAHLGGDTGMWDEEDGFFYDVLRLPDGQAQRLKVRSMVGPACRCARPRRSTGSCWRSTRNSRSGSSGSSKPGPKSVAAIHDPRKPGVAGRRLASILDETKLRRVLAKMLDENEFLSPFGIRSLSRYHADHPYVIHAGGQEYRVAYLPAESDTGMFGGNSNWRGPDLDAGQRPDHPAPCCSTTPTTATTSPSNARPAPGDR